MDEQAFTLGLGAGGGNTAVWALNAPAQQAQVSLREGERLYAGDRGQRGGSGAPQAAQLLPGSPSCRPLLDLGVN